MNLGGWSNCIHEHKNVSEGIPKALGQEGNMVLFKLLTGDELNEYCKWE